MNNPFNFHSSQILAAEAYNLPSSYYDIVKYDKSRDETGEMRGNTHESVAFAGPINSDGTYDETFNYHNSHTRTIMFGYGADRFKFQPAEGYTYQFTKHFYDPDAVEWKGTDYTATYDNPLTLDVDDGFRLEIVSATYDKDAEPPVSGCTDSSATNYNPDATEDDGSCEYDAGSVASGNKSAKNTGMSSQSSVEDKPLFTPQKIGVLVLVGIGLIYGITQQ